MRGITTKHGKSRNISLATVPVVNGNVTFDIDVFAAAVVAEVDCMELTDTSAMSALVSSGSKAYRLISNLRNVHT